MVYKSMFGTPIHSWNEYELYAIPEKPFAEIVSGGDEMRNAEEDELVVE